MKVYVVEKWSPEGIEYYDIYLSKEKASSEFAKIANAYNMNIISGASHRNNVGDSVIVVEKELV